MVGNIAFQLSFHLFWNTIRWSKFKPSGKSKTIPTFNRLFTISLNLFDLFIIWILTIASKLYQEEPLVGLQVLQVFR
jgi:hypothetical protein